MAEAYIGEIRMFGGNFAINQWQMCNGQLLAIAQNQALFSIIGTYYGGNGTQTFGLPDFRGRVPVHQGTGPGQPNYVIGQNGGTTQVTLLNANLPPHNHATFSTPASPGITVSGTTATGNASTPSGNYLSAATAGVASGRGNGELYSTANTGLAALNAATVTASAGTVTGLTGSSAPVSIQPPYLTVTFLICLYGIFPSRN
jgi:microcystin-dependent protein